MKFEYIAVKANDTTDTFSAALNEIAAQYNCLTDRTHHLIMSKSDFDTLSATLLIKLVTSGVSVIFKNITI